MIYDLFTYDYLTSVAISNIQIICSVYILTNLYIIIETKKLFIKNIFLKYHSYTKSNIIIFNKYKFCNKKMLIIKPFLPLQNIYFKNFSFCSLFYTFVLPISNLVYTKLVKIRLIRQNS